MAAAMNSLQVFLATSTWGRALPPAELDRVMRESVERRVPAQGVVAHAGEPAEYWYGVIEGIVKMSVSAPDGRITTLAGGNAGLWFGEGSLLKRERRRYDVVALRPTRLALVPSATFMRLRDTQLAFNHYLQTLMNARLGWFIALLEQDRLLDADSRVACCLLNLVNPDLYPDPGPFIEITQHELGLLCGTSRQRTNVALQQLRQRGIVRPESRGITVLDTAALRAFAFGSAPPDTVHAKG